MLLGALWQDDIIRRNMIAAAVAAVTPPSRPANPLFADYVDKVVAGLIHFFKVGGREEATHAPSTTYPPSLRTRRCMMHGHGAWFTACVKVPPRRSLAHCVHACMCPAVSEGCMA